MSQVIPSQKEHENIILIVDDEESIRLTLSQVLQDEGYTTFVAEDGLKALEFIHQTTPDLVILDIWMPEMDGIEVLRQIKRIDPEIAVLMVSGHASIATAVESTRLGAADFIEKPFDLEEVLAAVQKFIGQPSSGKASDTGHSEQHSPGNVTSLKEYSRRKSGKGGPTINPVVFRDQRWRGQLVPQRTLRSSAILYGQCLHSGKKSGLILEPLPPDSGIHFAGVADNEAIPAHVDFVRSTGFATTLRLGPLRAGTVEHLLSAFHAYGLSNVLIKCNDEVPVMDGSAKEFCELIEQVGVEEQEGAWYELAVPRIVRVGNEQEWIQIEPADTFSIDYTLNYPSPVGLQRLSYTMTTTEDYKTTIAPARTFGFLKDIGYLQKQGLAQGGRFDNFILIGEQGPLNVTLRFNDEFVRHKILDAIGDLFLLGRRLRGKVTAKLTGHSDNIKLLSAIQKEMML
jgi:UDP-3-O-[3-hydroxymyristoyl] N-acetylglucosamine deacetylase